VLRTPSIMSSELEQSRLPTELMRALSNKAQDLVIRQSITTSPSHAYIPYPTIPRHILSSYMHPLHPKAVLFDLDNALSKTSNPLSPREGVGVRQAAGTTTKWTRKMRALLVALQLTDQSSLITGRPGC
jgi:hypothetical protein